MARSGVQQLDGTDSITAGVMASLIATVIYSTDPAVFPGGGMAKWSLFGLLAGYFGLRLARWRKSVGRGWSASPRSA